ncbi:LysR substrate-binding domain-containing protein [Terriglobus saanensis]|uniref:LysR substrate-binding domain-containing protein n=1 Tax=Terriglobus saanensis TaxID=870903 RepID=UPI00059F509E|nr:LysR substrate-binding domain-containing protein [Terriglobus saanensis]
MRLSVYRHSRAERDRCKDLTISMELDSMEGLLNAVEAGLGITFVSRWAVRNQLSLGTVRFAIVRGLKLTRRFSMIHPAGPELSGNVSAQHFVHVKVDPSTGLRIVIVRGAASRLLRRDRSRRWRKMGSKAAHARYWPGSPTMRFSA